MTAATRDTAGRFTSHPDGPVPTPFDPDRFWSKVDQSGECWVWRSSLRKGYGLFKLDGKQQSAHRLSWFLSGRDIPDGLVLDHLCRNRACVNPAHLEPVTNEENLRRSPLVLNTIAAQMTHCTLGHPFEGDNLTFHKGRRNCKKCMNVRNRRYRQKPHTCETCGKTMLTSSATRHQKTRHP